MCLTPRHIARSAFTLVELLLVIAIIAVLAALTTTAVSRFRGPGPRLATTAALSKCTAAFDTQWNAVLSKAAKENLPGDFLGYAQNKNSAIQSLADPRARQLYIELRLAQAFPMTFSEALDPTNGYTSPPVWAQAYDPYKKYLNSLGATSSDAAQQAICLLMALKMGPLNSQVTEEVLGSTAAQRWTLSSGKQAWACADGWGQPLLFSRYTRKDPTNSNSTNPLILQPVILSVGPDRQPGVDVSLTLDSATGQYAYDNLYTLPDWDKYLKND
jgi:prepilin-type N-terminal cleavage/methylation domain-containing protein